MVGEDLVHQPAHRARRLEPVVRPFGGLAGKRTIVMGQPRGAPLLVDLLADQNFRPRPHATGEHFAGFVNAQPKPGEPATLE